MSKSDGPVRACKKMRKATPPPIFGLIDQPTDHRITVNITKLLHSLIRLSNIEVVITPLPNLSLPPLP